MRLNYDLHLHSCLSPCGDEEMTPYNLVNMAKLLGLDLIALTDHNTAGNCRSAMEAGREAGLVVVPGMELCTAEEIHVVCLFAELDGAEAFWRHVRAHSPAFPNDPAVFGRQLYMDARDSVLGEEPALLLEASEIGIDGLTGLVAEYGGFCYPAHIDRSSYSLLSVFGVIEPTLRFTCAEVSAGGDPAALRREHPALAEMRVLRSSDAHDLARMREAMDTIDLPENTPAALIAYLRGLSANHIP